MKIKIQGGRLYDSKNNIHGDEGDIFIEGGIVVDGFAVADKTIDARGKSIMPGGIDIHSHVATYGLNLIRGAGRFYSPREIGHTYARMGYTLVNEPFMTQTTACYVHHELSSIPILDTSCFLALNLRDLDKRIKSTKHLEKVEKVIPMVMAGCKAVGLKIYEPFVRYAERMFITKNVRAKKVFKFFSGMSGQGVPKIILNTTGDILGEEIENPSIFHFSHVGSAMDNEEAYSKIRSYLEDGASIDLGLFDFEDNLRISDSKEALGEFLGTIDMGFTDPVVFSHGKISDTEAPYFAMKLALSLPPDQISFSTDSPANASFKSYPKIFSWLMRAENRAGLFHKELPDSEYSLSDISRITRQNPADILGLVNKGHLGVGADADIAIYEINEDTKSGELEDRFANCIHLIKGGEVVIENHKIINELTEKKTFYRGVDHFDHEEVRSLSKYSTFRLENLMVDEVFTGKEVKV